MTYHRITEILKATEDKTKQKALLKWQKTLEKKLGIEGAKREQEKILEHGTLIHKLIEENLLDNLYDHRIKHLSPLLNLFKTYADIKVERRYWNDEMGITGQIDLSFVNEDGLNLIDWTTSQNFKKRAWVNHKFIQLGGYCHLIKRKVHVLQCVVIRPDRFQVFEENDVAEYMAIFKSRYEYFMKLKAHNRI